MTYFFKQIDRASTPRVLVILLVLEVLLLGSVNGLDFPLSVPFMVRTTGHNYLDMCAFCSAQQIYTHLDAFGTSGRHLQLLLLTSIDVAIPVSSCAFGVVALMVLGRTSRLQWLALAPTLAMFLDFLENVGIAVVVTHYPEHLDNIAGLTGFISGVKFCAYALTLVLILVLAAMYVVRQIHKVHAGKAAVPHAVSCASRYRKGHYPADPRHR